MSAPDDDPGHDASHTVLPAGLRRRRVGWPTLAAVAAVIALVVAVLVNHSMAAKPTRPAVAGGPAGTPTADLVGATALAGVEHATGTDYAPSNIVSAISAQLRSPAPSLSADPAAATGSATGGSATGGGATAGSATAAGSTVPTAGTSVPAPGTTAGAGAPPGVPSALAGLYQLTQLRACLAQIYGSPATHPPLSIDFARWKGAPAAVVLVPETTADDVAWVVGPECGTLQKVTSTSNVKAMTPDLLDYQEVPVR